MRLEVHEAITEKVIVYSVWSQLCSAKYEFFTLQRLWEGYNHTALGTSKNGSLLGILPLKELQNLDKLQIPVRTVLSFYVQSFFCLKTNKKTQTNTKPNQPMKKKKKRQMNTQSQTKTCKILCNIYGNTDVRLSSQTSGRDRDHSFLNILTCTIRKKKLSCV